MAATLLLADDSVTIQRVIELTFAHEDVDVVAVGDGDAAIARLESSPPDIVLADVAMPGKTGYDVAQHVKKTPRLAHIPVVLLTGAFEPIDRGRAAAVKCDGFLAKPFDPELVVARVKELLQKPPGQMPTPSQPGARRTDLDAYFDQLDAAFANLSSTSEARRTAATPPDASDVPLSYASPQTDFELHAGDDSDRGAGETDIEPHDLRRPPAAAPVQPAARALPSIAEAFAALLAAERAEPRPSTPPRWPAPKPAAVEVDDALVARIASRVAAQLSDRAVRETVREIVSATAERLVRDEIERIKATIT